MKTMYVTKQWNDNLWELRQERFRSNPSHPWDVCAVAHTLEEMWNGTEGDGHWVDDINWPDGFEKPAKV